MKILVLTSGGDASGTNRFLFNLHKAFGKNLFACRYGFKGLIEGDICPFSEYNVAKLKNSAGSMIKSSRCPEFATEKSFKKGLKNAQKFDFVVVLGGNGSHKGAQEIANHGVKTIFVPMTIDNDVEGSDYSIGFHTAVKACCDYIHSTMPSMASFDRCAVFEVMGRRHNAIALNVAKAVDCDYAILSKEDVNYDDMAKKINKNKKENKATCIVVQENIVSLKELCHELSSKCPKVEIKGLIVGHIQRGSKPTRVELKFAKKFAKETIRAIKRGQSSAILCKEGQVRIK